MSALAVRCPVCRRPARLIVDFVSLSSERSRRRYTLQCATGCVPRQEQLERLGDPMAC